MRSLVRVLCILALFLVLLPSPGATEPPEPLGPPFVVNTRPEGFESGPELAAGPQGLFAVWNIFSPDGGAVDVFGRRFGAEGAPLGDEFRVNSATAGDQFLPRVAISQDGTCLVTWSGRETPDGPARLFGRFFDASGAALQEDFLIDALGFQFGGGRAAALPNGDFFVVAATSELFGLRLRPSGEQVGMPVPITSHATGGVDVAADAQGRLLVIWSSEGQDGDGSGVFGRRLDESGAFLGDEIQINAYTTGHQFASAVAASPQGDLIVLWLGVGQASNGMGIFARRIGPDGTLGPEYQVDQDPNQGMGKLGPDVALDAAGNALMVWENYGRPDHVWGRMFDAGDQPVGDERVLNVPGSFINWLGGPRVAPVSSNRFAAVWMDGPMGQTDIVGRLFAGGGSSPAAIPVLGPAGLLALALGLVFASLMLLRRRAGRA